MPLIINHVLNSTAVQIKFQVCCVYSKTAEKNSNLHINPLLLLLLLLLQSFNGIFSRTTWVSRYQKGKTNLDFTGARDSEWQWHQLGHMQVCTSLQTDNHASTTPLCFLQAGCPSCCPTNSVKALKAFQLSKLHTIQNHLNDDPLSATVCINLKWKSHSPWTPQM